MRPDEMSLAEQLVAGTAVANFRKQQRQEEPMDKVQFETNIPVTLALKYADGKRVDSNYNEYETYFSTVDGKCFYASPVLSEKIATLGLNAREEFVICKREVRNGGAKPKTEWQVYRQDQQPGQSDPTPTAPAQAIQNGKAPNGSFNSPQNSNPPLKMPMDKALTLFLVTAGRSTRQAEQVLAAEGGSVRFDNRDVAALATTMFIQSAREGYLTWFADPHATLCLPEAIRPGTKEAQRHVAERKIADLKRQQEQPGPQYISMENRPWKTRGEMKAAFSRLREWLGEVQYAEILGRCGASDPAQLKSLDQAVQCFNSLVEAIRAEVA